MRQLTMVAVLAALCGLLSACDKCGGFQELRVPGRPGACADQAPR